MSRIYWDTMLFVYWLEDHPQYAERTRELYVKMNERRDTLCTSVFTIGEVLTGVYKRGTAERASQYREFFRPPHIEILPFNSEAADRYARIRADNRVSPADGIHLACAGQAGVDLFLTNDRRLNGLSIQGIQFIASMDVNLF
jgi:predicted nucleic acid-binding protein